MNRMLRWTTCTALILGTCVCALPENAAKQRTQVQQTRIDINHASMDELMAVPGMTRSWAGRIVRFRPYHSRLDLLERGVLSSGVYYRIKDRLVAHRDKQ